MQVSKDILKQALAQVGVVWYGAILIILTTIVPTVDKDIKELHMSGVICVHVIEMEEIANTYTQNLHAPVIDTLVVFGPAAHELMMDLGTRL